MNPLVLVGVGGALGATSRYLLSGAVTTFGTLPAGTLLVNVLGSFGLGLVMFDTGYLGVLTPEARLLLGTGFFGGFTTFSTFSYESFALLQDGNTAGFLGNVALNVLACLGAVLLARGLVLRLTGVGTV